MSAYDSVKSMVVRGERLFPFTCFDENINWEDVGVWLDENIQQ